MPLVAGPYVPGKFWQLAVKGTRAGQIAAIAAFFLGEQFLGNSPAFMGLLTSARENKIACGLALYATHFFCELVYSTAAFEITYEGKLVFSKLQSRRYPRPGEVAELLRAYAQKRAAIQPSPSVEADTTDHTEL